MHLFLYIIFIYAFISWINAYINRYIAITNAISQLPFYFIRNVIVMYLFIYAFIHDMSVAFAHFSIIPLICSLIYFPSRREEMKRWCLPVWDGVCTYAWDLHFCVTGLICYNEWLIHLFMICYLLTYLFSHEERKLRNRVATYSRNAHLLFIALRIPSPKIWPHFQFW